MKKVLINVSIDPDLKEWLKLESKKNSRSISGEINNAIKEQKRKSEEK